MVGNINEFNKTINPLTGEEESSIDYFYINSKNQKVKLYDENYPDSVSTFSDQQELTLNYQDSANYFKILCHNKIFLFSKSGKQLSAAFDNIYLTNDESFFITENFIEVNKKPSRTKGIIDLSGKTIVKNKYHQITINSEDSIVFCCSAVFNNKLNDDVFDFKGKFLYSKNKHIEFASKNICVLKVYEPKESFLIENSLLNKTYSIEGQEFLYLKHNKAIVVNNTEWIFVDLETLKEKKINKEKFSNIFFSLINHY